MTITSNRNKLPRARLGKLVIDELSIVDRPCVEPALALLMKRAPDDESLSATKAAARLARESPRMRAPVRKVSNMTLEEALAEIADLKAKLAELDKSKEDVADLKEVAADAEKRATMTDAQRAYHKSLDKADGKAFLAKSNSERESAVEKARAADPILHTCEDGTEIRKSDGTLALKFAKQADAATKIANIEKAARERTELVKRATDMMGTLAGTHEEHADILKGVEATGDDKVVQAFTAIVNAATTAMKAAGVAKGAGGEAIVTTGPQAEFDALVTKHVADHKVDAGTARLAVVKTEVGRHLYGAIELQKKSRAHG